MTEIWSNIPNSARLFVVAWFVLFAIAFYLFSKKSKLFIWVFGLSVFSLASAFALFAPYLFRWDEQFHALVGKNLSVNPFHPILIDLDPSLWHPKDWANTYTWLHKQPLFLYQIALSIKVFGASVYAVRLPSILLHVAGSLAIFDIGKMMFSRNYGFLVAVLFSISAFPLGLLSGRIGTDHNDSVFMIYVLLSFWAWFKFYTTTERNWVKWIGIFVGCAILTKWLVGLLVFAPWGIWIIVNLIQKQQVDLKSYFKAIGIALLISIPWQIYIFIRFPLVAKEEMTYNGRHFFEVLEGHSGDWSFHFQNLNEIYFDKWLILILFVLSAIAVYFSNKKAKVFWGIMTFSVVLVYFFFSMAATKMGSFTAIVFPLLILLIAFPVVWFLERLKQPILKNLTLVSVILIGFFLLLKPNQVIEDYGFGTNEEVNNNDWLLKAQWKFFDRHIYNKPNELVINAALRGYGAVSWQFKNGTKAISNIPTKKEIESLKKAGYSIYCVNWQWGEEIPNYILSDSTIKILQFE